MRNGYKKRRRKSNVAIHGGKIKIKKILFNLLLNISYPPDFIVVLVNEQCLNNNKVLDST
jgi:hypothetical protein